MTTLNRGLGFGGALMLILGYVVGGSIFVLPGELAASAGPAVALSHLLAGAVAFFAALATAQVARAHPTSGGNYAAVSHHLSPGLGFSVLWAAALANATGNPLIAYAFAEYFAVFVPDLPRMATAFAVLALFTALNLAGVVAAAIVQAELVVLMMAALLLGVLGTATADPALWTPFAPEGLGVVLLAAVPAHFSYAGFLVLAEMGEEVRDPTRAIPAAIAVAFVLLLATYSLVPLALMGHLPWAEADGAGIAEAATRFLPPWAGPAMALAALAAAATSINGSITAQARAFLAAGRDGVLPSALAWVSPRTRVPVWGVWLTAAISVPGIAAVPSSSATPSSLCSASFGSRSLRASPSCACPRGAGRFSTGAGFAARAGPDWQRPPGFCSWRASPRTRKR